MRVVFLGNARWSVPSLEAVAASSHDLALVVTRSPRLGGRGNRPLPTPVAQAAGRQGLPLEEVETVKSGPGFEAIVAARPDVLAVVAYGEILPAEVLDAPTVAPVNVHFSLLPKLRGAAPVQRALLEGHEVTGVTTIRMDAGMDTGPILLQTEEPVRPEDDAGWLGDRLADLGGRLLVDTLDGLEAGTINERPQDEAAASSAPKLKPEDRLIDWSRPAEEIVRKVRALAPEPGAFTTFRGRRLLVQKARVKTHYGPVHYRPIPGAVTMSSEDVLAIAASDWFVQLQEVRVEGRRRITAAEFVRGYQPRAEERLGEGPGMSSG